MRTSLEMVAVENVSDAVSIQKNMEDGRTHARPVARRTSLNVESLECTGVLHRECDNGRIVQAGMACGGWYLECTCGVSYRVVRASKTDVAELSPVAYGLRYRSRFRYLLEKGYAARRAGRELNVSPATAARWSREDLKCKRERVTRGGRRPKDRSEICNQIRESWCALMQTEPPVRITVGAILKEAGRLTRNDIQHDACSLLLAELVETQRAFHDRAISWLAVDATSRGVANCYDAMRLVGLRVKNLTKKERERIQECCSRASDKLDFPGASNGNHRNCCPRRHRHIAE
jgi:hypothetical protein